VFDGDLSGEAVVRAVEADQVGQEVLGPLDVVQHLLPEDRVLPSEGDAVAPAALSGVVVDGQVGDGLAGDRVAVLVRFGEVREGAMVRDDLPVLGRHDGGCPADRNYEH
jgi:hypothetical protein